MVISLIIIVGGILTGVLVIPIYEDKTQMETVYTLEIDNDNKTFVYEIVINSTDKSKWNTQDSNIMINGSSYSLQLFTESTSEIICWQGLPYKTYRLIAELPEGWYQEDQVPELNGWQILQYNYTGCVGK